MTREELVAFTAETARRDAAKEIGYFRLSDKQRRRIAKAKDQGAMPRPILAAFRVYHLIVGQTLGAAYRKATSVVKGGRYGHCR